VTPAPDAKFKDTTRDFQSFAGNKCFSDNMTRAGQYPTVGLSGYRHHVCGGFLIKAFKITQTDSFQFLNRQKDFTGYRNPLGDERCKCWIS
jgi:hypothetical protein